MTDQGGRPSSVRVLPDVPAVRKEFDYSVPNEWHDNGRARALGVGAMVRIELHGRRVAGWVTELDPETIEGVTLRPLAKVSGVGPAADIIELARWASHRWVGAPAQLLRTASPPTMVPAIAKHRPSRRPETPLDPLVKEAFALPAAVVRVPPLGDRWPLLVAAVSHGNALILTPSLAQARSAVGRLRRLGVHAGMYDRDWAYGRSGATIVGTRAAAFAPVAGLAAILMIDEHDEVYQEERSPTWHAREVVLERARRAGVPCVLSSPMPSVDARHHVPLLAVDQGAERAGWPPVTVVDPRADGSARGGLWTEDVVEALRGADRALVVLNRKGRSKLLACRNCDELAVCTECDGAMQQPNDSEFRCARTGHTRPVVCTHCGGTAFKNLRIGVSRAAEELEALVREPVREVTADTGIDDLGTGRYFVGTEAVLHRIDAADLVVFADFDQELLAPRYRSSEQAMSMLVRAARLVAAPRDGSGHVIVQTRQPGHPVLDAAATGSLERWGEAETARRDILRYPPFSAIAEVSGAGANAFMERLGQPLGLQILSTRDDGWMVRSDDHSLLSEELGRVERPKGRLRLAVDPLRI